MPLNDAAFAADLNQIFNDMWNAAENGPYDVGSKFAEKLAKRINDEIRNGDVQSGIPVVAGESGSTTGIGKIK